MNVPFVDLKAQYASIQKEIDRAIAGVIDSARFIQGPDVALFEKEFSEYLGASYCIGVNSGTDALILGIRALGLSSGDEVIVPVNTFIATVLGVSENGAKPVFVDCDSNEQGMDLADLKKKITSRTKAVILVHLYGQPEKLDEIKTIIKASGKRIYLIEDSCQAHGARYKGKRVGTFGIFSAFSFYPGKNLGAYGDGGAIVTDSKRLAFRLRMLREYGQKKKYIHDRVGINSRLDSMQAAVLRVKLRYLNAWNTKRQKLASYYSQKIHSTMPHIKTPLNSADRESVFHLYVIKAEKRDGLHSWLESVGVQSLIHYPIPLHLQKAYASLGYKRGDFPHAESMAKKIISLPIYPELSHVQADVVLDAVRRFYAGQNTMHR